MLRSLLLLDQILTKYLYGIMILIKTFTLLTGKHAFFYINLYYGWILFPYADCCVGRDNPVWFAHLQEEERIRKNRLALLKKIADLPKGVADLSVLPGF